jgi:hypothetical protein
MPRKRNPVGLAAGKLILAIRKECAAEDESADAALAKKVVARAHTLLQASQSSSVSNLLHGMSVVDYLDRGWLAMHPAVQPSVDALVAELDLSATEER